MMSYFKINSVFYLNLLYPLMQVEKTNSEKDNISERECY